MVSESKGREKPCCGPFAQKLRRLEELERAIDQLRNQQIPTVPRTSGALGEALGQRDVVRKWLLSHKCRRMHQPRSGHASRF